MIRRFNYPLFTFFYIIFIKIYFTAIRDSIDIDSLAAATIPTVNDR